MELKLLNELNGTKGLMPLIAASDPKNRSDPPWFAMPEGRPISSEVVRRDDARFVIRGVISLASMLASLHERGISHRDVKPDNIYLLDQVWTLADFGIASFPGKPSLTQKERKLGPAYFIAPEMLNEPHVSDGRPADVYSLAKTLWVLLSGQAFPPPGEQRTEVEGLRISSYINIPGANLLDKLIGECTRHAPNERPSAKLMSTRLKLVLANQENPAGARTVM